MCLENNYGNWGVVKNNNNKKKKDNLHTHMSRKNKTLIWPPEVLFIILNKK